jgi:hypothetical protein
MASLNVAFQYFFPQIEVPFAGKNILTQYCAGGKIEKNKMGGTCGAYGGG